LFAFKSPLSSGVILADEVGLGKTIEAGLVLTQYWSERKRKILIIAPSSLRKQWSMELKEKFFLDSFILDGKSYKDEVAKGNKNPFEQKEKIVITSYQFASRHNEAMFLADFQLAVIDEAHKMRNYHKGKKAKMSFAIANALRDTKKILLTATPLQNSLLEIFGLVSVIDDFVFGDKKSFRKQFSSTSLTTSDMYDLKERLKALRSNDTVDRFSSIFWDITKAELKDTATFDEEKKEFIYQGTAYQLISASKANPNANAHTYRLNSPLGEEVIDRAKQRELTQTKLLFDLTHNRYKISVLDEYKNKRGFLKATKVSIDSYDLEEYIIITALTSDYKLLNEEVATKLLSLEAKEPKNGKNTKVTIDSNDTKKLEYEYLKQKDIILKENEATNQTHFINQSTKLHKWAEDKLASIEKELKDTKSKIKELNRQSIATENITEQTEIQLQIKAQEKRRRKIQREIFDIEEEIEEQRDELIEELKKAKEQTVTTNELFTIEWEIL